MKYTILPKNTNAIELDFNLENSGLLYRQKTETHRCSWGIEYELNVATGKVICPMKEQFGICRMAKTDQYEKGRSCNIEYIKGLLKKWLQ